MTMSMQALGCFERDSNGDWLCTKTTTVLGPAGPVTVSRGMIFHPRTVYAGFDDFTAHLARVASESASLVPR